MTRPAPTKRPKTGKGSRTIDLPEELRRWCRGNKPYRVAVEHPLDYHLYPQKKPDQAWVWDPTRGVGLQVNSRMLYPTKQGEGFRPWVLEDAVVKLQGRSPEGFAYRLVLDHFARRAQSPSYWVSVFATGHNLQVVCGHQPHVSDFTGSLFYHQDRGNFLSHTIWGPRDRNPTTGDLADPNCDLASWLERLELLEQAQDYANFRAFASATGASRLSGVKHQKAAKALLRWGGPSPDERVVQTARDMKQGWVYFTWCPSDHLEYWSRDGECVALVSHPYGDPHQHLETLDAVGVPYKILSPDRGWYWARGPVAWTFILGEAALSCSGL